jgi:multidrug resistance protein, MATE family
MKNLLYSECATLFKLSSPLVVRSLTGIMLGVIDTIFIGRVGIVSLAGVASAVAVYSIVIHALAASTSGYQILAARSFGNNQKYVSVLFFHSLLIALTLSIIFIVLIWHSEFAVKIITSDPEVIKEVKQPFFCKMSDRVYPLSDGLNNPYSNSI